LFHVLFFPSEGNGNAKNSKSFIIKDIETGRRDAESFLSELMSGFSPVFVKFVE
jgi:hypothetical protein